MAYSLPDLPYAKNALEPHIDAMTMEIHHDKHHNGYVTKVNDALKDHANLAAKPIDQLMRGINEVPENIRQAVINNGGGHSNHSLFWTIMGPGAGGSPSGPLGDAINSTFGDFGKFQSEFKNAAATRFGSGWAWLVYADGGLKVLSTANQDSPFMQNQVPIIGLDVWEHAYYLKYQNRRPEYIDAWWNVVNWQAAAQRYADAKAGKI